MLLPKFFINLTSEQIVSSPTSPGCFQSVDWNRVIPRTKLKIYDMRTRNRAEGNADWRD